MGLGCQPNAQHLAWRTRVSLFVWNLTLPLSSFGDPAISYATAGTAVKIMGSPKYDNKLEIPLAEVFVLVKPTALDLMDYFAY